MTIELLVLTGINVFAALATIFVVVKVHLTEFKRHNEVQECKAQIQSLRGRIVGQERWDEVKIRDVVEEYLAANGSDVGRGDDLGSLMQVFAMLQGQQQGHGQEQPAGQGSGQSSRQSPQHKAENPPGLLGGNREFAQSGENG